MPAALPASLMWLWSGRWFFDSRELLATMRGVISCKYTLAWLKVALVGGFPGQVCKTPWAAIHGRWTDHVVFLVCMSVITLEHANLSIIDYR